MKIFPDDITIRLTQSKLFIEMEDIEKFHDLIDETIERCSTEEKQYVVFTRTYMLHSKGYYDEALAELEKDLAYITDMKKYHDVRSIIFLSSGNLQQAWEEFRDALPPKNKLTIEDLDNLIHWLNTGMELKKWGKYRKYKIILENCLKQL